MHKILILLSNRATYTRHRILLEKMDSEFQMYVIVTSSLLGESYANTYREIGDKHTVITLDFPYTDGDIKSMPRIAGFLAREAGRILHREDPDCVVLIGDRFELLPVAMAAAYLNIPLAHIQGGEISGNIDDKVRNSVTALADIHFTSHKHAAYRVAQMGHKNVFNTGCPSIDLIKELGIKRCVKK